MHLRCYETKNSNFVWKCIRNSSRQQLCCTDLDLMRPWRAGVGGGAEALRSRRSALCELHNAREIPTGRWFGRRTPVMDQSPPVQLVLFLSQCCPIRARLCLSTRAWAHPSSRLKQRGGPRRRLASGASLTTPRGGCPLTRNSRYCRATITGSLPQRAKCTLGTSSVC